MKQINIQSLLQANTSLNPDIFKRFLDYYNIEIKYAEVDDLRYLVKALSDVKCGIRNLDGFYVGYKIPQIGKEFDLLRFNQKSIINIEIKNNGDKEKIKKQLIRNKYYLSFIGREVHALSFISDSLELYFLRDDDNLERTTVAHLVDLLNKQKIDSVESLDALFNPCEYLVSPFNSTKKFLEGAYFLTHQQEDVKNQIIDSLGPPKEGKFISIMGSAGTGKTLLTYDIASHLLNSKRNPLIIHCGQLNNGHIELIENSWTIAEIKNFENYDFENYDLVILDEAQRIYPKQLDAIIDKVRLAKCCCIFSHDKLQTLAYWEQTQDISTRISLMGLTSQYKLSEKIRTNKEIATFIKLLFNKKRNLPISSNGNIQVNYFNSIKDATDYLDALDENKWEILRFTPSRYNKEHHEDYSKVSSSNSHRVIGQEFDNVAITIDKFFSYDDNGELIYRSRAYYDMPKMLFQNITRSRKKLNLIIIDNEELLDRCIAILRDA